MKRGIFSAIVTLLAPAALAAGYEPPADLVEAAKREGAVTIYTANQLESEQQLAKKFNERFPGINVEIVRAPGSRLIARIDAEAASGKLGADIVEFSDSGLAQVYNKLFADYAPPNAKDYPAALRVATPNLWPKTTWGYVLAYNKAIVKQPPKSWHELTQSGFKDKIGWIPAAAGGTSWTLAMFQRQVLGEQEWKGLAEKNPVMFPSDAPLLAAVIRGEVRVAALKTNTIIPALKDGAPIGIVYPSDGVPLTVSVAGLLKAAPHPNAARLFLDWVLSDQGQKEWVETSGGVTVLAGGAVPQGADASKFWIPDVGEYARLRESWTTDWNTTFNYRQ